MNRILLSICFALCLASPLRAEPISGIEGATPEKLLGGAENLGVLTHAREAMVYRVLRGAMDERGFVAIDGERCDPAPKTVSGAALARVVTAFADAGNFGGATLCDFNPGMILRFKTAVATLDMVVCFSCHEMALFRDGTYVHRPLKYAGGSFTFYKSARSAFSAIYKAAFPG